MRQPCSVSVLPEAGFHLQCLSVGQCFAHRAAFPASRRYLTGARKAALRQWTKGTFLRTVPGSYYGWVITESYSRLAHSAPSPAHTPASRTTSDSLCGGSPCGMYSVVFNAWCGFALPGTCCRDKAQSATSFRLNGRKRLLVRSAAMRCEVPVFIANAFVLRKSAPFAVLRARAVVMLRARCASGVSILLQLLRGKSIIGNYV